MNFALYVTELRGAIRRTYGCEAVHLRSDAVELSEGEGMSWEGKVELFALLDCAAGSQCYGWGIPPGEGAAEYVVILHKAPVDSAYRAVLAWMMKKSG